VVSFTPRPIYPQGKSPWYPLDRRLHGPQSHSRRGGEEKFPTSVYCCKRIFRYRLSPVTFGYTLVSSLWNVTRMYTYIHTTHVSAAVLFSYTLE
jgi:hypothetical protein